MPELIKVEMTEDDAVMFRLFQKYYKAFSLIENLKFKSANITFTMHFDTNGNVGNLEVEKSREFYKLENK